MDQEPDVIRREIDETRSSLTEKVETLEHTLRATVQNAKDTVESTIENVKETVEGTIENVKESVQETVESVKESFDLQRQVEQHPWAGVGCSLAAGFAFGYWLEGQRSHRWVERMGDYSYHYDNARLPAAAAQAREPGTTTRPEPGLVGSVLTQFGPELNTLKGLAIGALVGLARDYIKQQLPQFAAQIDDMSQRVTTKLGGEPVPQPVMPSQPQYR